MNLTLDHMARFDHGLTRQDNENSTYAGSCLLVPTDDMGGHAAGEIAFQLMIAVVSRLDNDQLGPDLFEPLRSACIEGSNSITDEIEQNLSM